MADTEATSNLLDKRLANAIRRLSPTAQRAFAVEVTNAAIKQTGLDSDRDAMTYVNAAFNAPTDIGRRDRIRDDLAAFAKHLDGEAFRIDEERGGNSDSPEYIAAFNRARAADAALATLYDNPLHAAVSAAYEATVGAGVEISVALAIVDKLTDQG